MVYYHHRRVGAQEIRPNPLAAALAKGRMMEVNLVMFSESGSRRDFPVSTQAVKIGRKDDCDIRIPLSEVSRHHATLQIRNQTEVVLKDLGSANGTFVNNKRIKEVVLHPGDHVVIGPVVFTVQVDGKPDEIRGVKTKLRPMSAVANSQSAAGDSSVGREEEIDPISALEALASSADQTAIDAFDDEDILS